MSKTHSITCSAVRAAALALSVGALALGARSADAAEKAHKYTVGVFLPTTMTDGQARFQFAEKLAADLGKSLNQPIIGRSFGRYEDFAKAAADGTLDLAVVDAWAAAESSAGYVPVALGSLNGETYQRWAILGRGRGPVKDLKGKRLAVVKGIGAVDAKFVSNLVFGGDLDAQRHFKLVPVPGVESALKMMEVRSAEAALVPLSSAPKESPVVFRSNKLPIAVVIAIRPKPDQLDAALQGLGGEGPFDRFVPASGDEVALLRKQITTGPAKRQPVVADSPVVRLDANALVNVRDVGLVLPSFVETMEVAKESPDD